ncbi:MAG: dihydroneopterin aldolase [Candidatus Eisenbacteria bacterium]|nr:dihydroneopterin aldolase [Candidatus Latescibacterota bacterium]MBD3303472.1 dihydroneopterin aldolase [Candidatus Eisenbacteria bacterium]
MTAAEVGSMDVIRLRDLMIFPRLGVAEIEKEWVQKVSLDLELHLDLSAAASSDDVRRTVDYEAVYRRVREVSDARKFHLLESLAGEIAAMVLREFDPVQRTVIRIRKANLPFDANLSCVEIEMERGR